MPGTFAYANGIITVTDGTSDTPADFASMYAADVAGGWGVVTNPYTGNFVVNCSVYFGDGSTATYFRSYNEQVWFTDGKAVMVKAAATLQIGLVNASDKGYSGSNWSFNYNTGHTTISEVGATVFIYGSSLKHRANYRLVFLGDVLVVRNSIISGGNIASTNCRIFFGAQGGSQEITVTDTILDTWYAVTAYVAPTFMSNTSIINVVRAFTTYDDMDIWNLDAYASVYSVTQAFQAHTVNIINPKFDLKSPVGPLTYSEAFINDTYTVDIKVVNNAGDAIEGALVSCYDESDTEVFADIATDANGVIAQQQGIRRQFSYNASAPLYTETVYTPHSIVISATGYKTLIIPNVTVDSPIDWTIELQPIDEPPAPWEA